MTVILMLSASKIYFAILCIWNVRILKLDVFYEDQLNY